MAGRLRRGRVLDEEIQQRLHAEVVDARAEEHGREFAGEKFVEIELVGSSLHQFDFVAQLLDFQWKALFQFGIVDAFDDVKLVRQTFAAGRAA